MEPDQVEQVLTDPVAVRLLDSATPARLGYVALDGTPRVVPVGFDWSGGTVTIGTVPGAAKVEALRRNPQVALTIDTSPPVWPPNVLLLRGTAAVTVVDGVFEEYLTGGRKLTPREHWDEWEAGVRALYDSMVRIDITVTWAKVHDFVRRIPAAVQDLAEQKFGPLPPT